MHDSKLGELARLIAAWPGLAAGPTDGLVEDCHQILMHTFAQLFAKEREAGTG